MISGPTAFGMGLPKSASTIKKNATETRACDATSGCAIENSPPSFTAIWQGLVLVSTLVGGRRKLQ